MSKTTPIKRSFSTGEISPLAMGRTDSPAYENGAFELTNFMVRKHGAITRRPGSQWIGKTKLSSSYPTRLHNFQWSVDDGYLLEFGGDYLRIWHDDALILGGSAKVVSTISDSAGLAQVTTTTAHGYATGNTVTVDGVTGTTSANGMWTITVVSGTSFTLNNSTHNAAYVGGGIVSNTILDIVTPYSYADIDDLSFAQSADTLWVAHPNHAPRILRRFGAISWQLSVFETEDGPYISDDASTVKIAVTGTQNFAGVVRVNTAYGSFTSGNYITVKGIQGTTEANGEWLNAVNSRDQVVLSGSAYANAYTGGGTVEGRCRFQVTNVTDSAIVYNAGTALTANSTGTPANGFVAGDVGWLMEVDYEGDMRLGKITSRIDAQRVKVNLFENYVGYLDPSVEITARKKKVSFAEAYNTAKRGTSYSRSGVTGNPARYIITAENSSIFNSDDKGKWLRSTVMGGGAAAEAGLYTPGKAAASWWKIYSFVSTTEVGSFQINTPNSGQGTDYTNTIEYDGLAVNMSVVSRTRTCQVISDMLFFKASDVGRHIRMNMTGVWIWGKITAVAVGASSSTATLTYYGGIPVSISDPTKLSENGIPREIRLGAWSDTNGWPATVAFHGGRLVFGRTALEPQTLWFSVVEDYKNFATTEFDGTVTDDLGITTTLASRQLNSIAWILSQKVLMIGTTGGEWQIKAGSGTGDAITPSNIQAIQQSSSGSSIGGAKAVLVGNSLIFIQREQSRVMEMAYDYEVDAWNPVEMSTHADGMFLQPIKQVAYQSGVDGVIWLSDGFGLYGCTFAKHSGVIAFWVVSLNLSSGQNRDYPFYHKKTESISVVSRNGIENLYVGVKDVDKGSCYIIKIPALGINIGAYFVDEHLVKEVVNGTVTGMNSHYPDGSTVYIAELGTQHQVWNGGTITNITQPGFSGGPQPYLGLAHIGKLFTSRVAILPVEGGSPTGTSHGKTKRTPEIDVATSNTLGYRVFEHSIKDYDEDRYAPEDITIQAEGSYITGSKFVDIRSIHIKSDYSNDAMLFFESLGVKPFTLCYYAPHQHVFE